MESNGEQIDSTTFGMPLLTRSIFQNGVFRNPWPDFKLPGPLTLIKMAFQYSDNSQIPNKQVLNKTLPIVKTDMKQLEKPGEESLQVTWIGHASLLVQMDGLNILTDPVFSSRCSPSQYFGPMRYRDVPMQISELPKIHAVVISHNHYDHLDYYTVKELNERFGKSLQWFVPLGLKTWMISMQCLRVVELDWWAEHQFSMERNIKFVFTPAKHWSKRTAFDDNKHYLEPPEKIQECLEERKLPSDQFFVLNHGETRVIGNCHDYDKIDN